MNPDVSAGSNQVGASETWTTLVSGPWGAADAGERRHTCNHVAGRHPEQVAAGQRRPVVRFAMML
jgi:hypothetical protein